MKSWDVLAFLGFVSGVFSLVTCGLDPVWYFPEYSKSNDFLFQIVRCHLALNFVLLWADFWWRGGVAMMDQLLQQVRASNTQQMYDDDWLGPEGVTKLKSQWCTVPLQVSTQTLTWHLLFFLKFYINIMFGEDWGCKNCNSPGPSSFVVVSKIILSGSGLTPWPAQPMDVIAPAAWNQYIGSVMICVLCCCVYVLRIFWTYWWFMFASGFFGLFNLTTSQWAAWVGLITQNGERTLTSASIWLRGIPVLLGSNSTQQRTNTQTFIDICGVTMRYERTPVTLLGARFHTGRTQIFAFWHSHFNLIFVWSDDFVVSWLQWSTTQNLWCCSHNALGTFHHGVMARFLGRVFDS